MKTCTVCGQPLDAVARAAGSLKCCRCSWESGEMRDGVTDIERIPDGDGEEAA